MGTVPALADYGGLRGTATHSGGAAGRYAPTGAATLAVLPPRACEARAADSIAARLREAQEPMRAGRFGQAGPDLRRIPRARPDRVRVRLDGGAGRFRAGRNSTWRCALGRRTARRTRPCRAKRRHGRPRSWSADRLLRWRDRPAAAARRGRHGCRRARAIAWRSGPGRRHAAAAAVHRRSWLCGHHIYGVLHRSQDGEDPAALKGHPGNAGFVAVPAGEQAPCAKSASSNPGAGS